MKRKAMIALAIVVILAAAAAIWYHLPIRLLDADPAAVTEIVVFNGNTGNETHITDEVQIEHIVENLNQVRLKRWKPSVGYSGFSFRTTLVFAEGEKADGWDHFIINAEDTVRKDPFFYTVVSGTIDYDYLAGIVT